MAPDPKTRALLAAKDARIQMLLRMLAETTRERDAAAQERDTYAHGLHQLKAEMFAFRMRPLAEKAAGNPDNLPTT